MSLLNLLGIASAYAANTAAPKNSFMSMLPMLLIFIGLMYFLIIRPQTKRAKDHKMLVGGLKVDDEVVTSGGLLGKIVKVADNFVVVHVAEGVELTVQKSYVTTTLPKGTVKTI